MRGLKNRVAIVTGAAGGIGREICRRFIEEGATVVALDVNAEALKQLATDLAADETRLFCVTVDITDYAKVTAAVDRGAAKFGRLDILHNNVGVTHMGGPVELSEEQFAAALDLNIGPIYRTSKAVIPHMLRQGGGAIVNISSLAAIRWTGYPYFAYSATKAAVNQATVALAMQYARQGIRANCIMPGLIDTPLIYKQISGQYASIDEMVSARNAAVPLGKMGTAWDIANAAVFLASDEAKFITGVCLPVDGGQSCAVSEFR